MGKSTQNPTTPWLMRSSPPATSGKSNEFSKILRFNYGVTRANVPFAKQFKLAQTGYMRRACREMSCPFFKKIFRGLVDTTYQD